MFIILSSDKYCFKSFTCVNSFDPHENSEVEAIVPVL